jgi:hypothetical protein
MSLFWVQVWAGVVKYWTLKCRYNATLGRLSIVLQLLLPTLLFLLPLQSSLRVEGDLHVTEQQ